MREVVTGTRGQPHLKRVPCQFFQTGRCNKGHECAFGHFRDLNLPALPPGVPTTLNFAALAANAAVAASGPGRPTPFGPLSLPSAPAAPYSSSPAPSGPSAP